MKVYLQEELIFNNYYEACNTALKLPSFSLCRIEKIVVSDTMTIYRLSVYCFDDEVDVNSLF